MNMGMLKKQFLKLLMLSIGIFHVGGLLLAQEKYGLINSGELIQKGVRLHDQEKYDEALELYNKVPENDTNYTLAVVEKALTFYAKKDYDKAITMCREGLQYGSEYDYNLYVTLGSAYDDAGKPEEALTVYDKAIKEYPKNHLLIYNKAVTVEKLEKYDEAVALYKQVLQITPYHATTHYRLGRLAEEEGDLTRAMLCYNTFLLIEPTGDRALSILQRLDNMVNRKYDDSKAKGIQFAENGEDFSEIETLIRKQLALNKKYKLKSKADYPIIRQDQALFSYLVNHNSNKGFWESYYVPFYVQLYKENRFEIFSYYLLSSSANEKIQALVTKNKSNISKFNDWLVDAFAAATSKREIEIDGKPVTVTQIYRKGGSLYGVGAYVSGTEKKMGVWLYYYNNGRLMSTGSYDASGFQTGIWKFYHPNGLLRKELVFSQDKANGPYTIYSENGNIKEQGFNKAGELDGDIKVFSFYGGLTELHHFNNGQHEGKYEEYYANGKLNFASVYVENKFNGAYKAYHSDGKLYIDGNFKDGLKDGAFTVYSRDGKVELKKKYLQGKEDGAFIKYYNNGETRQEGNFKNGKVIGAWKSYYLNGQLEEANNYNDAGNEDGIQQQYDVDGKLYYEAEVQDGRVTQYKYFDKSGKMLADVKLKSKQEAKLYYPDGSLHLQGNIENGKRNGFWKEYSRNGILIGEFNYADGKLNGVAKTYFLNGKPYKVVNYKDGDYHGEYLEYFRNGQLYKSAWYEDDKGEGDVTLYNRVGIKERFYTLLNGKLNGKYYTYDVEGKLSTVEKYENGLFTGMAFYDTLGKEIKNIVDNKEKVEAEYPTVTGSIYLKRTFLNGSTEGTSNSYYLDNKLRGEGSYLDNERDGLWKWYNPDNTLSSIRNYLAGELQGFSENYDLFGKIRSRSEYINNNAYGVETLFYYDGKKKEEITYWDDSENGPEKYYGYNGEYVLTLCYEHGTPTKAIYENGKAGKPDTVAVPVTGIVEAKYANGKTAFLIEYKNGYRHGKYREFFEDGTPCRESQYVDGSLDGERKTWYRNGKLRMTENFKANDNEGVTTLYYENGVKKAEISYKSDALHGPVKYYDAGGKLSTHYIFYNRDMIQKVF